jgi:hypothetical protein
MHVGACWEISLPCEKCHQSLLSQSTIVICDNKDPCEIICSCFEYDDDHVILQVACPQYYPIKKQKYIPVELEFDKVRSG